MPLFLPPRTVRNDPYSSGAGYDLGMREWIMPTRRHRQFPGARLPSRRPWDHVILAHLCVIVMTARRQRAVTSGACPRR